MGDESGTESAFGEAESIVGCGIEIPDARGPGGIDRLGGLCLRDLAVEVPELGGTEPEAGYLDG
jgi:hypothetical protein